MTDPSAHPAHPLPRRTVLQAGAWTLPVLALAAAAPRAAASGGEPSFTTSDPVPLAGDGRLMAFPVLASDLPAVPAAEEQNLIGVTVDLCLPEGLRVVSVSGSWGFAASADDFEGGEVFVFNTVALPAGSSDLITITIEEGPAHVGLNGELGALVLIAGSDFLTEIAWQYAYPGVPTAPLPNCSAGRASAPR